MDDKFDFILPGECRIDNLDKTLQEMKALIQERKKKYRLDLRYAKEYDLAGIQLFMSLLQELTKKKCRISIKGPLTPEFRDILLFLDLIKFNETVPELFYKHIKNGDIIYE